MLPSFKIKGDKTMSYTNMMNPNNGMMNAEALRQQFPFTLPALV